MTPRLRLGVWAAAALAAAAIIGTVLVQACSPRTVTADLQSYAPAADGRQITVTATMTRLDTIEIASAQEDATSVKVTVLLRRRSGTSPADLLFVEVPVPLNQPLDGRTVVDANGKPIPLKRP